MRNVKDIDEVGDYWGTNLKKEGRIDAGGVEKGDGNEEERGVSYSAQNGSSLVGRNAQNFLP
ncbi:hypothetical protein BWQ96_02211 [Gracilariopsis chorda]|uniref:Uncharacterized protein n=1 Tax=Gracilariopsis chorda TaxID=448386 RepID=A0A2V3J3R0_9FLOR|nr:hypothetical protein BWQ96_02211 [Gracilariopsis chorda]|eukprot:PXF48020.1 hypothetical protein BWQ96_02211 [Gracilariopsis chorda]